MARSKSPSKSPSGLKDGHKAMGQDGTMWVVKSQWVREGKAKSPAKAKSPPPAKAKTPAKAKAKAKSKSPPPAKAKTPAKAKAKAKTPAKAKSKSPPPAKAKAKTPAKAKSPAKNHRIGRPSPAASAAAGRDGDLDNGQDGNIWMIYGGRWVRLKIGIVSAKLVVYPKTSVKIGSDRLLSLDAFGLSNKSSRLDYYVNGR